MYSILEELLFSIKFVLFINKKTIYASHILWIIMIFALSLPISYINIVIISLLYCINCANHTQQKIKNSGSYTYWL